MVMKSSSTDEVTNSDATSFLNQGTRLFLCNCFNIDIWYAAEFHRGKEYTRSCRGIA